MTQQGQAQVYLKNNDLPLTIKGAAHIRYFEDGSVHVLDQYNRPVFIGAPNMYVAVVMEYADEPQPTPPPMSNHHIPNQEGRSPYPFPYAPSPGVATTPDKLEPGSQRVTTLRERSEEGIETQEMEAVTPDFPSSPRRAGNRGKTRSHSGSSGRRTLKGADDTEGNDATGD